MAKFCCSNLLVVGLLSLSTLPQSLVAQDAVPSEDAEVNQDASDAETDVIDSELTEPSQQEPSQQEPSQQEPSQQEPSQQEPSQQEPATDSTKDKATDGAGNSSQLTKDHFSGSTIVLGIGRSSLGGDAKDYGNAAWQWGLQYNHSVYSIMDNFSLKAGLDFRYSKYTKDLDAVRVANTSATATLKRYDYSLLIGLHYGVIENFALFTEIGPSLQSRSFWIDADSGGDYHRSNAMGYLWRLGTQYYIDTSFGNVVTNLFYGTSNGAEIKSGRTKYNLQKLNYNGPSSTLGLEIGLTL